MCKDADEDLLREAAAALEAAQDAAGEAVTEASVTPPGIDAEPVPPPHILCAILRSDPGGDYYAARRQAAAALEAAEKERDETRCPFGCGPYPEPSALVGEPGVGLVPACPVHGWVVPLLDARDARAEVAERRAAALEAALAAAGSELEAGNDRGAKHLIQDALAAGREPEA